MGRSVGAELGFDGCSGGAINGAIQIWSSLITENRDLEAYLYNRVLAYQRMGQLDRAAADLQLAVLQRQLGRPEAYIRNAPRW